MVGSFANLQRIHIKQPEGMSVMLPTLDGLVRLSDYSFEKAVDVLIRAFWDDPLNVYLFPDETKRKRFLPAFFEFRLKQGKLCGEVYTTSDEVEGVAIWKYYQKIDTTLWRIIRLGGLKMMRRSGLSLTRRMMKINDFVSKRRNEYATPPYMHLGPIAVDPEKQGKGYGSKLIRPMLTHLDEMKWHCYLEAQSESNVSLYEHFGFVVLNKGVVPDTEIPHWDMMRPPQ
ncbi:MAG: GNAT family N-acetyltransferase [Candidatus Thorarchaeota archaeon]